MILRRKKKRLKRRSGVRRLIRWLTSHWSKLPTSKDVTGDPSNRLKLYLFNVGQGDHILLELPNGDYGIIDFYFTGSVGLKEPPALTYLENVRRLNPTRQIKIAFVCISHPDFDHVKGADTFLRWAQDNKITIENFWLPAGNEFTKIYEQYKIALRKYAKDEKERDEGIDLKDRLKGIRDYVESKAWAGHADDLQGAIRPLTAELGGGIEVILIAPLTKHIKKFDEQSWEDFFRLIIKKKKNESAQTNLMSSVLLLVLGKHRLLFGGDAGLNVWLECLNDFERTHQQKYFGPCVANFVKASHHGSRNSSSVELWQRILDKNAKIGISAGKTYGHPHPEMIRDILTAARQAGSAVQILATNTCTECLANQTIPSESLNSLVYESPPFPIEVEEALRRVRSSASPRQASTPVLGSYIFRFAVEDDTVSVTRGLLPRASRNVKCIYENAVAQPFPQCSQKSA